MTPDFPADAVTLGVGVDLVEVDRIRKSRENHGEHFLEKVFTPEEQEYCLAMSDPDPHFAARFAAKEAVSKAFGTGIGAEIGWLSVSVSRQDSGGEQVLLSLSHLKEMAVAFAVITR